MYHAGCAPHLALHRKRGSPGGPPGAVLAKPAACSYKSVTHAPRGRGHHFRHGLRFIGELTE